MSIRLYDSDRLRGASFTTQISPQETLPYSQAETRFISSVGHENLIEKEISQLAERITTRLSLTDDISKKLLKTADLNKSSTPLIREDYALICRAPQDRSYSLIKIKVASPASTLASNKKAFLRLLNATATQNPAIQAFCSGERIYIATMVKNVDQSFSMSEQEVFLYFSPNLEKAALDAFKDIVKKLWNTLGKRSWSNRSVMAELITEASKTGKASIRFYYKCIFGRINLLKNSDNSYSVDCTSPNLTQEELLFLIGDAPIDPASLDTVTCELYDRAIDAIYDLKRQPFENRLSKITLTHRLSNVFSLQVSIQNDILTFGSEKFIGSGGIKKAQKIARLGLRRKLYVKCFAKNPAKSSRLLREAESMQLLTHPHVLQLRKFSYKSASLQTEYCDQGTARSFVRTPPKDKAETMKRLTVLYHAALGLAHIHKLPGQLAHMDFKPRNLFLSTKRGKLIGKVGDINLSAKNYSATSTFSYLDVEGLLFRLLNHFFASNQACDVWALGLTLFECMYSKKANPIQHLIEEMFFLIPSADIAAHKKKRFFNSFELAHWRLLYSLDDKLVRKKINNLIRKMLTLDRAARVHLDDAFLQEFKTAIH